MKDFQVKKMLNIPIATVAEVTSDWLTCVLRNQGYLDSGAVSNVAWNAKKSSNASTARLALTYSDDASGILPPNLFLKLCNMSDGFFGNSEVVYYTTIAAEIYDPPIPRCYHCAYSVRQSRYHLLLEDLSDTHAHNWNVKPTWERATKTIDAMAQLHASWWNHSKLSTVGKLPDRDVIEKYVSQAEKGLVPMLDDIGKDIPQEWYNFIHHIFSKHCHRLIERACESQIFTCIHGDPNPGNILSPINPNGKTYLIDRQLFDWSLSIWIGVSDIAYMMVHWWDTESRRQLEKPLLELYYERLKSLGVQNYSFTQLWNDYRLCAMQSLYVATSWCINKAERQQYRWVWLPQLRKTMITCVDLKCMEIL